MVRADTWSLLRVWEVACEGRGNVNIEQTPAKMCGANNRVEREVHICRIEGMTHLGTSATGFLRVGIFL